ncbi:hypothetical protein AB0B04_32290 [Streptomyces xinghaiensis]|uniref:Uncharacterized protein n=2 Tax=Streptomyces TaxID=1883 RepID=A0A3M8ETW6_9ACTN|nr:MULTISPECIES: hypothetical protein [Streptomyces]KNE80150.1 hypothetical protein ADZ36_23740 [Streptomyces fradiae]OFA50985.1 hypothetical protein BEN35_15295 [Streptomyces fradiae]PQM19516.1 hypothetical protein Sfr7A_31580 [Streptomyces xinghaiensis]RKM90940.1 hypothetical protein SFRA_030375 [Streptomyces xinghaiensis]RNC68941.1 hypothetical protein DC095_030620 [Streptomyces xinghaiensis]
MDDLTDPAPWLLAAFIPQALAALVVFTEAVIWPRQADDPHPVTAVLHGRAPTQRHGHARWPAAFYTGSAVGLAAAAVCSAVRHDPPVWTVVYAGLMALTALGAWAWGTPGSEPADVPESAAWPGPAEEDHGSDGTPPGTPER